MTNTDYKEEKMKLLRSKNESTIVVDHLTIRQSIFFLVLRLFAIEAIAATFIIAFHYLLGEASSRMEFDTSVIFNMPVYLVLVAVKMIVMVYFVVQEENEYYEINPSVVIFKIGFFVKKEDLFLV